MPRCKLCNEERDEKFFPHENGELRKFTCYRCMGKRERAKLKMDMLESLSRVCNCCGEDNPYFLTLDHIKNDGAKHREKLNEQQIYREARREGWPKKKYQVLCMNCNFAKGHFEECPHKLGITSEKAYKELERVVKTAMRSRWDYQASYTGNQWGKV
jgi:hypothetical protein